MSIENEALDRARWLVKTRTGGLHRELVESALRQLEYDAAARGAAPWAELPIAVHLGLRGGAGQAQGLAAVTTLLHSGLALADGSMEARQALAAARHPHPPGRAPPAGTRGSRAGPVHAAAGARGRARRRPRIC